MAESGDVSGTRLVETLQKIIDQELPPERNYYESGLSHTAFLRQMNLLFSCSQLSSKSLPHKPDEIIGLEEAFKPVYAWMIDQSKIKVKGITTLSQLAEKLTHFRTDGLLDACQDLLLEGDLEEEHVRTAQKPLLLKNYILQKWHYLKLAMSIREQKVVQMAPEEVIPIILNTTTPPAQRAKLALKLVNNPGPALICSAMEHALKSKNSQNACVLYDTFTSQTLLKIVQINRVSRAHPMYETTACQLGHCRDQIKRLCRDYEFEPEGDVYALWESPYSQYTGSTPNQTANPEQNMIITAMITTIQTRSIRHLPSIPSPAKDSEASRKAAIRLTTVGQSIMAKPNSKFETALPTSGRDRTAGLRTRGK